jgi:sporulation protein YlmC with PRC-barrel domain
MRRYSLILVPLLVLALVLAACGPSNNENQVTPGALGTSAGAVGTELGAAATPVATTAAQASPAATTAAKASPAATTAAKASPAATAAGAATAVPTTAGQAGAALDTVAMPFNMFKVATDVTAGATAAATPATGAATPAPKATTATGAVGTPAAVGTPTTGTANENRAIVRAEDLIGSQVVDKNGDPVGTILDVLVDTSGTIRYVVMDVAAYLTAHGGTAGTTTGAATPEPKATSATGATTGTSMGLADDNTVLVMMADVNALRSGAIRVDKGLLDQTGFIVNVSGASTGTGAATPAPKGTTTTGGAAATPATGAGTTAGGSLGQLNGLIRAGRFSDFKLMNKQDETLGDVRDLLLDVRQGMVDYSVVDFGGFLGVGEQTVAVPWDRITVQPKGAGDANLVLDVSKDTLQNAPTLKLSDLPKWPQPMNMQWETETRTFWQTAS